MANLIIPAAAATAGWFVGGVTGAAVGWSIGAIATAERQTIAQGQIGDLRIQTSAYGEMIPLCAGTQRLSGNIIWADEKQVVQRTERVGKGGFSGAETVITTYTVSMAIAICVGEIDGITRCWSDGTLVAEVGSGQTKLPGTLYLGDNTQNPDPTIVSVEGAGNVPDYRGMAYMVLTDFDLGASGRVPSFSFEVIGGAGGIS